jgi:methionyl-tRNA synthetase
MALARTANDYISLKAPWTQRKSDMAACGTTMNVCIQTVRTLAVLMAPFLPHSAESCRRMLNLDEVGMMWAQATAELPAGHRLGEPEALFRKLDAAELFAEGG